jgi:hypothetical protein
VLRDESRFELLEKRELVGIFGFKREEVTVDG